MESRRRMIRAITREFDANIITGTIWRKTIRNRVEYV
jgi:hypothetical protein